MIALTCGIEICLDHLTLSGPPVSHGVLRTLYEKDDPNHAGSGVDLHVLIAAGMPTQCENIVSRKGGVFIRCDGGNNASPRSNSVGIKREGTIPQVALRAWSPTQTQAAVQQYVGTEACNRLAVYAPIDLS